jgi:hypothetical protein
MNTHYENTNRAAHHVCPRCEGNGEVAPVATRLVVCGRCFGTGEDIVGTLANWEADLTDLRNEWKHYNSLMLASRGGRRFGLSKKVDALALRGKNLKVELEALRAEVEAHKASAPF